jgi:hypothetical protein
LKLCGDWCDENWNNNIGDGDINTYELAKYLYNEEVSTYIKK